MTETASMSHHSLAQTGQSWRRAGLLLALYLVVLLLGYWGSLESMVAIWLRSETFAHGFIIAPLSLWLIWRQRHALARVQPRTDLRFLLPMAAIGGVWLMGYLVDALVVKQLAFVLLLIAGVCAILGAEVSRLIAFPLGFLIFMVPMGEDLIPPMMDFTASSTVWLIRHTGVPVYREGLFFSLPSGNWSVVEACSGVRYLIASITLGCLYAYLTYRSYFRRALFVLFAIVMPVVANTLRAYMIVMIGHYSDMQLAVGVDHLIYGWVFFGLVIFLMFWLGSFFRDQPDDEADTDLAAGPHNHNPGAVTPGRTAMLAGAILVTGGIWSLLPPLMQAWQSPASTAPVWQTDWAGQPQQDWLWQPVIADSDASYRFYYKQGNHSVGLFLNQYQQQRQGSELVSSRDHWLPPGNMAWRLLERRSPRVEVAGQTVTVEQAHLKHAQQELLVWRWYHIGGVNTANPYVAKLVEALTQLLPGQLPQTARVYLVTPITDSAESAKQQLIDFVQTLEPNQSGARTQQAEAL